MTASAYAPQFAARQITPAEPQPVIGAGFGYAPVGRRIAATFIDIAFVTAVAFAALLLDGWSIPFMLVCAVQAVAVEWGWEAGRGRTLGKAIMGLRVVKASPYIDDAQDGLLPPGPWRALIRTLTTMVATALAVIGVVAVEWSSSADSVRHRGMQDRLSGTSVIDTRVRYVVPRAERDDISDNTGTDMSDDDAVVDINVAGFPGYGVSGDVAAGRGSGRTARAGGPTMSGARMIDDMVSDDVVTGEAVNAILRTPSASRSSVPSPAAEPIPPTSMQAVPAAMPVPSPQASERMPRRGAPHAASQHTTSQNRMPAAHTVVPGSTVPNVAARIAANGVPSPREGGVPHTSAMPSTAAHALQHAVPSQAVPSQTSRRKPDAHATAIPATQPRVTAGTTPAPVSGLPGFSRPSLPGQASTAIPPSPESGATGAAKQVAVIYCENGRGVHLVIPSRAVLGRRPASDDPNDVLVPVPDTTGTMSRSHALLEITAGRMWVTDLGSTNGSEILGEDGTQRLAPHVRTEIPFGTRVFLGNTAVSVSLLKTREKK